MQNKNIKQQRETYLDILRAIAILAMTLDHTLFVYKIMGQYTLFWQHLMFSPDWFLFLSGYTNELVSERNPINTFDRIIKWYLKKRSFLLVYIFFSLLSLLLNYQELSVSVVITHLLNFSAVPVYYFFQLLMVCFILYPIISYILRRLQNALSYLVLLINIIFLFYIKSNFSSRSHSHC
jgi:uncharacterized membrane protein